MKRRSLVVILPLVSAASAAWCVAAIALTPGQSESPHWSPDRCASCHTDGSMRAIPQEDVAEICLSCHDGVSATAEPHPIARSVRGEKLTFPSGWPTVDGALTCLTCHDVLAGCGEQAEKPRDNPMFLRGSPPFDRDAFCAHCHQTKAYAMRNPHRRQGAGGDDRCGFCHGRNDMDVHESARTGARLVADQISLCGSCHRRHVDFFEPGHLHVNVTATIRSRIKTMSRNMGFAGDGQSVLPLVHDERIACSTCHNPHSVGDFPSNSLLSLGAMNAEAPHNQVPLRLPGRTLCAACHGS